MIPVAMSGKDGAHPSQWKHEPAKTRSRPRTSLHVPRGVKEALLTIDGKSVKLTNLTKLFWPREGITKRDLLQYYADIAPVLLPHLEDRAMVMKRYPDGAAGHSFFMKHAPDYRPEWLPICSIAHNSGNVIDFAVVQDTAALLWVVNLGCIDLNQWYAPCCDVDHPDYLHFDLDPGQPATFDQVREVALLVHRLFESSSLPSYAKTTGSRGIHVYVPIVRGPTQKQVWAFAKQLAQQLAAAHPALITAEYRIAKRPAGRILVDYNQNAWGRTLASVYSVRPRPRAPVSTPVTWDEVERGIAIDSFRLDNVRRRIGEQGDLWKPLLRKRGRANLERLLKTFA